MSKVTITNIENIEWARRLIITYYLSQDCNDPSVGSWEYVVTACGYRSLCDTDWILLTPNTQHPLHSNVIKYHGLYTYVWDYGGVQGLDPAAFDAQHSYVIQLALYDPTCNLNDPCAFAGYITQYGDEPIGVVDTNGDVNNTLNNCGPGYILRADSNGCLYCELLPTDPNTDPGDGPIISGEPPVDNGSIPPIDPPVIDDPLFGSTDTNGSQDTSNNSTSDLPNVVNVTPGPSNNSVDIDNFNSPNSLMYGQSDVSFLPSSYNTYLGTVPADEGLLSPGKTIGSNIIGTTFGGKSPSVNNTRSLTSKAANVVSDYLSPSNAYNNRRRTPDQLNLSAHDINPIISSDINTNTNNSIPDFINTTRVVDAISISENTVKLRGKTSLYTKLDSTSNLDVNSINVKTFSNLPVLNDNLSTENRSSNVNAPDLLKNDTDLFTSSPSTRTYSDLVNNIAANLKYIKDLQTFTSNFNFVLFVNDSVNGADGIFCEAKLSPIVNQSYRLTMSIFLKSVSGIKLLAVSRSVDRKGHILISKKLRIGISNGDATVIAIVTNSNNEVQGIRYQDITISDI
jgi:hypothetical protein